MSDNKIVLFSAFRHVVPSDYEDWFEQMATKGWHIDEIKQWDTVYMRFHRGNPKKYRFVYDPKFHFARITSPFTSNSGGSTWDAWQVLTFGGWNTMANAPKPSATRKV